MSARASTASDRCYFRAPLGPELREDLDFRAARIVFGRNECVIDNAFSKTASLWCSSRGCVTPTHFDLCHGFLTQIRGRKRVLLVPPEHTRSMYRADPSGVNPNSSPVDLALFVTGLEGEKRFSEAENKRADAERARFPKTRVALGEIREVTLEPGDTLYIPPFWWHHVVTLETLETLERDSDVCTESISREEKNEREKNERDEDDVSVSLLLAFDPVGDESVHPCVDEEG